MIKWEKKGLIVSPKSFKLKWWKSFGMDPCSIHLKGDVYRIFFCGRDSKNVSNIGFVDYDLSKFKVVKISKQPVLKPGSLGSFDDNGVTASLPNKCLNLSSSGWATTATQAGNNSGLVVDIINLSIGKPHNLDIIPAVTFPKLPEGIEYIIL